MPFSKLPIRLRLYIIVHVAAGLPALWVWSMAPAPSNPALAFILLLLTALVATWKVELTAFQGRMTPVFALVCLAMLLQGAQAAVACAAVGALVTTVIRSPQGTWKVQFQRQALHQVLFNPIHCGIVCLLAALTYRLVRSAGPPEEWGRVVALSAFTAVYFVANSAGISLAVAFKQGVNPFGVWKEHFLWTSPNFFVSAFAAAIVWLAFHTVGAWAFFLIAPLYLVYYSYWLYLDRLRQTNTELKNQIADRERAEGALRQEREFLQAVLENVGDAIIACDARGVPTHLNRAAREFLGESLEAPITEWSRCLGITAPAADAQGEAAAALTRALTCAGVRNVELYWPEPGGGARTVLVSGQAIEAAVGERLGGIVVIHDISDRRRAEQEHAEARREHAARTEAEAARQRSAFLAEATGILSASLDYSERLVDLARVAVPFLADGCIVEIVQEDGTLGRVAGAHIDPVREALLLAHPASTISELSPEHPLRRAFSTNRSETYPYGTSSGRPPAAVQLFLGSLHAESYICVPLQARGNTLGVITLFRMDAAANYEPVHIELAEDLARRAALMIENARLYQQAQEHDRRKNEFLAMLAHELRNPLAPILNAIAVMRLRSADDPSTQRLREIVERQTRHLARLVDDLLDISRITRGTVELKSAMVRLDQVVDSAVQTSLPHIRSRCHALDVRIPETLVWLDADATRLAQVLSNLLNNAAKYTDPGGRISLEAQLVGDPGEACSSVLIQVRDNGRGIPAEMIPHIFDLFTQVDATLDRSLGGLGIGLTLVKQLVEMHGGSVSASSEGPGRGSEFTVLLPVGEVGSLDAASSLPVRGTRPTHQKVSSLKRRSVPVGERVLKSGARRAAKTSRVLIVEDNPDAAEVLAELLEMWGHEVYRAGDGEAALTLAMDQSFDVMVLDIGLPGMDGYEIARRLRSRPPGNAMKGRAELGEGGAISHRLPMLIALTGYGGEEDRRRALEAGFDHHLTKPVDPEALQRLLGPEAARTA